MPTPTTIDSNDVVMSFAEELTIGVLPVTPVWYQMEPNTVGDFGGDPSLVSRKILGSTKIQKGSIVGIDPKVSLNVDHTKNNLQRLLQGFFFADIDQLFSTAPLSGTQVALTSVASADKSYNAASGLATVNTKHLLFASGFTNSANNGLKTVATVAAGKITVAEVLVNEAAPPAAAKLEVCGVQFAAGDAVLTYAAPVFTLNTTAFNLTTLGIKAGDWLYVGGDAAAMAFATAGAFYGRVASAPTATAIVFDKTRGGSAPIADAGTAKTIQVFFANDLRDQTSAASVRRTYDWERQLGNDGVGTQSEHASGCVANELGIKIAKKAKIEVDLGFVGLQHSTRTGTQGISSGTRVAALGEDALNTSSDIYSNKLAPVDAATLNPTAYFGYITEANVKLSNNAVINEAVGNVAGFDVNRGDFEWGGDLQAYFTTNAAIAAVRAKALVTWDLIVARGNWGMIIDVPALELAGGLAKAEKNKPVMLPLKKQAVQNALGYTASQQFFPYLPTIAMPVAA